MRSLKNKSLEVSSYAFERVKGVKDNKDKYKSLVKKMPMLIQKNGLINTILYNYSKSKSKEHERVLSDMIDWVVSSNSIKLYFADNQKYNDLKNKQDKDAFIELVSEFIELVSELDNNKYRFLTKELISLFGWLKRIADGMIASDDN